MHTQRVYSGAMTQNRSFANNQRRTESMTSRQGQPDSAKRTIDFAKTIPRNAIAIWLINQLVGVETSFGAN